MTTRALVVFHDPEGARWQWLLKPGFRHVFCVIEAKGNWIMVDARDGVPVIEYLTRDFDLAGFYREHGLTVIETEQRTEPQRTPFVVNNCVGLVKAVLAIRAPLAWTPYQLFRHLRKRQ